MSFVELLADEAGTHLLNIGSLFLLDVAHVEDPPLLRVVSFSHLVAVPLNDLLLHGTCAGVWRSSLLHALLRRLLNLLSTLLIRSDSYQAGAYSVH